MFALFRLNGNDEGWYFVWYSYRQGIMIPAQMGGYLRALGGYHCEHVAMEGGDTSVGYWISKSMPKEKIGFMVASNSGRPGGAVGKGKKVDPRQVHAGHKTQEENTMAAWLRTQAGQDTDAQNRVFASTIAEKWGLTNLYSLDGTTVQGVNYQTTRNPKDYADAWVVDAELCKKTMRPYPMFNTGSKFNAKLVFVAGPNAGCIQSPHGSTARTFNKLAAENYDFFRPSVKAALGAGFDAMIEEGVTVALVARVSCGIYAGPHQRRICMEFSAIVDELLAENIKCATGECPRGSFFKNVLIPLLDDEEIPPPPARPAPPAVSPAQQARDDCI